jgi:arylformamidase
MKGKISWKKYFNSADGKGADMKIYDISLTISPEIPVWPGDLKVELYRVKKIEEGAHDNLSQMKLGVHTGTHVDAPYHFVANGLKVDELPIDLFVGPVQVVQLPDDVDLIGEADLKKLHIDPTIHRILLKTRNSKLWEKDEKKFNKDFVAISADAAEYLVKMGMRFVGIDYLSVGPFHNSKPTHDVLLGAGLALLEGANLSSVPEGTYQLVCLPLKLGATEGAPARAILIKE